MVVVGNCCYQRFTDDDKDARLQRCRLCGQGHKNRKAGVCNGCGKCPHGKWLPEYEDKLFCMICFDGSGKPRPPPPPPPACEVCGSTSRLNRQRECSSCGWEIGYARSGQPKWSFRDSAYGLCPGGDALWALTKGELIPRRFLSPDLSHRSLRMFLEKKEGCADTLRRHDEESQPILPRHQR